MGGFNQVEKLYNSLKEYETNRDKYSTIDEYMTQLIEDLLKE